MSDLTVARRYAAALYEEADERGIVERIDADMNVLQQILKDSRELVQFFESPLISDEKKETIINRLFSERMHALTLRLLHLLIEKGRDTIAPALAKAYREMRDRQEGIVEANVRLAAPLNEEERSALVKKLEAFTDKKVRLRTKEDPNLLGGLVVRIGDVVYDGSIHHQLERLRENFFRVNGDG